MRRFLSLLLILLLFSRPAFADEEITVDGGADVPVRKRSAFFLERSSNPSTPAANGLKLFSKDNGSGTTKLYTIDSAGTVTEIGSGGGDNISVDGSAVTDPNFASTGQIDFVNSANTVTANVNDDTLLEADLKAVDTASDEDVLTFETTTGDFEWHSRDQIVGGISAGALPNDSVLEADLKAVDAASDEECLTYETTTGDFEWQACGSGTGDITAVGDVASGAAFDGTAGTTLTGTEDGGLFLVVPSQSTVNQAGSSFAANAGNGNGSGGGGDVEIFAGANDTGGGSGGVVTIQAGNGSGDVNITAGDSLNGTGGGGFIYITAGNAEGTNESGGDMEFKAGRSTGSDLGGSFDFYSSIAGSAGTTLQALQRVMTVDGTGILQVGDDGLDGKLKLYSEQGATDYQTTFQPGTQTQAVTYTLPNDDGDSGEVLSTNGSGVLDWIAAGAGDITTVGDVTSGAAFEGTAGTTLTFNDADGDQTVSYDTTNNKFVISDNISIGSAGVDISTDGDGAITFLGLGDGSDEDLTLNLDDTANTISASSSTGVTEFDFGTIDVNTDTIDLTGTGTLNGLDAIDGTGETTLEAALDLPQLQGQIGDAQIADGAVDGGSGGEIADDSIVPADVDESQDFSFVVLSNKQDRNNTAVDDDDCSGEQGKWWYDTTDSRFEFCNANTGAPELLGAAGSGDITDVYNCSSGDCASITMADGDLLDASGVTVNTTTEGIILPAYNASGTAAGQCSYDNTNDILYCGNATNAAPINVVIYASSGAGASATRYTSINGSLVSATNTDVNNFRTHRSMIAQNLHCTIDNDPGGVGRSWDCSLNAEGSNTTLTANIANGTTEGNDTTHRPTIAADSMLSVEWLRNSTANSPGNMVATFELIPN